METRIEANSAPRSILLIEDDFDLVILDATLRCSTASHSCERSASVVRFQFRKGRFLQARRHGS
jgi:hypothetical protein